VAAAPVNKTILETHFLKIFLGFFAKKKKNDAVFVDPANNKQYDTRGAGPFAGKFKKIKLSF
jgi:hypothetical protein